MSEVTVYGRNDCENTTRTRDHLMALGVVYDYIDVEGDADAAEQVKAWNRGELRTPTVVLAGDVRSCDARSVLSVPDNTTLDVELDRQRLLPLAAEGDGSIGM